MTRAVEQRASKVPEVTLVFWIVKIAATTLGETSGDTVAMTLGWGYRAGTAIFLSLLVALIAIQIAADKFHPFLYWTTIVASTTAAGTMSQIALGGLSLPINSSRLALPDAPTPIKGAAASAWTS